MPPAHVSLVNAAGSTIRAVNSDEQGSFGLADIDPGSYQLVAESPSFVSVVTNVAVSGAQQQNVTVQFQQIASAVQATLGQGVAGDLPLALGLLESLSVASSRISSAADLSGRMMGKRIYSAKRHHNCRRSL